jgi:hypothetical protein
VTVSTPDIQANHPTPDTRLQPIWSVSGRYHYQTEQYTHLSLLTGIGK